MAEMDAEAVAGGYCFIPFHNLYWMYVAYVGLARDMEAYCDQRNIQGARVADGVAVAFYVLSLACMVP